MNGSCLETGWLLQSDALLVKKGHSLAFLSVLLPAPVSAIFWAQRTCWAPQCQLNAAYLIFFLHFFLSFAILEFPFEWSRHWKIEKKLTWALLLGEQRFFFFFPFDTDRSLSLFRVQMETSSTACISPTSQPLIILSSRTTQYRWANQHLNLFRNQSKAYRWFVCPSTILTLPTTSILSV